MPNLVIKEDELQQLDKIVQELPTKYGFGLVQFFQAIGARRHSESLPSTDKVTTPAQEADKVEEVSTQVEEVAN